MYPTRGQILSLWQTLLDDPNGRVFNDIQPSNGNPSLFQQSFQQAYNALYSACLNYEIPRITDIISGIAVPPGTTQLTPAQMGIQDFGQYEYLTERLYGSQNKYLDLTALDRLPQRAQTDRLKEFVWRNDTFYFVGATSLIDLKIEYETTGEAPTSNTATLLIDSCDNFLAWFAAGVAGPLKGRDELGVKYMLMAVGPKYDWGQIGGELYRLIQPKVRQRQKVQIAHKPYTAQRRLMVRMPVPYVAAQQGTTGGGAQNVPIQFSTTAGNIVGAIDGVNAVFWLSAGGVTYLSVYLNGVLQTAGTDYNSVNNQITFTPANIPTIGSIITAEAFLTYSSYTMGGFGAGGFGG